MTEMYNLPWFLAVMYYLLSPFICALFGFVAIPLAIYGFFTRKYRPGLVANRIALSLSVAAVLLSALPMYQLRARPLINGEPVDHSDPGVVLYGFVAVLEAVAFLLSIFSMALHRKRTGNAGLPLSSKQQHP